MECCVITNCEAPGVHGRGLCHKHYSAMRRAKRLDEYPKRKAGRPVKSGRKKVGCGGNS